MGGGGILTVIKQFYSGFQLLFQFTLFHNHRLSEQMEMDFSAVHRHGILTNQSIQFAVAEIGLNKALQAIMIVACLLLPVNFCQTGEVSS